MKPVILNAGDPDCIHITKINSKNIGTCKLCGREINYDYAEFSEQDHNVVSRNKVDILPYDLLNSPRHLNY